jgi:hypothetical protein
MFNAILNALKSGVQGDPQRIEERPQRVEGGIPFFFLPLRMRRNHNGLACQELLTRLTSSGKSGAPGRMRSGSSEPLGGPYSDVLTSVNDNWKPPLTGHWSGREGHSEGIGDLWSRSVSIPLSACKLSPASRRAAAAEQPEHYVVARRTRPSPGSPLQTRRWSRFGDRALTVPPG